ncbi:uncharacterized protein (DUF1501 family) [Dyadobacter sp. BE34]|uniref:Uncharacterized protein (DUF1501 family) n=1 Tax=Dyadobacter fermentans TaxID=94254 RepID=A0ABU1R5V9_9BACT|nr:MULTISPECIES: DUF1501 domain-containing protein [Dyadobacter]MDR6808785.1 uncharacterized protein (DUF1501 family) [Dyadobacter fermentans]MDR7046528.1 uncharacterized protein (DUF1501 family) [Dyadobacter sp. BE242]MDR7200841.1 uncharacterized protein (DUF1501 family) [Dyadobacter sp. BE34]MDR7218801.1 uncharacterized protein (DUF1501 family) [Dyadobacter sp. BE31]MDR7266731.1 uncharacterized protein (DUF1501 family) [Dyadobacter sp. BE32]
MKRRDFLASASAMALPVMVNGFGITSLSNRSSLVRSLMGTAAAATDRILVIIYLNGGNDGLNTVIPLQYYSKYQSIRTNIAIPQNKVLTLSGMAEAGLHPSMTGMRDMYNQGRLAIVNSVSYPNPNQSHHRSSDIWMTATDANQYANSGWAGRYLDNRFPGYPQNYPNDTMKDPLALQIGVLNSTSLLGPQSPMNISVENVNNFYALLNGGQGLASSDLPCCEAGEMIKHVRQQQLLSTGYSGQIKRAYDAGSTKATYPTAGTTTELSEQLKIVARLIHGGLQTKIYFVELGGFDTHGDQVTASDTTVGTHANLLKKLSEAVSSFQNDLVLQGTADRVIGMTFSDFGRRANSNASRGTDHGVAAPMFVFGTGIKRQMVGVVPDLNNDLEPPTTSPTNENQEIKMQVDFRRIYSDILRDWFGAQSTVTDSLLFKNFKTTSLFSNVIETTASGAWPDRSIWSAGRPPGVGDYVRVNPGHVVAVGQNITVRNIEVEGGGELNILGNYTINTTG